SRNVRPAVIPHAASLPRRAAARQRRTAIDYKRSEERRVGKEENPLPAGTAYNTTERHSRGIGGGNALIHRFLRFSRIQQIELGLAIEVVCATTRRFRCATQRLSTWVV